ncbi:methyltransferase domain-containing protein [Niveibacterium sp. 24ML]|uniref:class I SAM-dependent methyltransferase n=1 Tax=Niveibacterium sp. 24ML TaxID=2985512 RepID=UPI0022715DF8|nr:methyltransferase domain-containing protein [Niveibacterium sp. 24ML]MCX9156586.1 methyltransferase domain-containing protein [Niveibacterium sp. 24ML]
MQSHHHAGTMPPSAWVRAHAHLVPTGRVLDLACGSGRHARFFAAAGWPVLAVDRDATALQALAGVDLIETRGCELETGAWPLQAATFAGVVVTHYLHRPRRAELMALLQAGGVLIYETFMAGHERHGRPSRPEFLLQPGELLDWAHLFGLEVLAFEEATVRIPREACLQRLCARRPLDRSILEVPTTHYPLPTE